MSESAPDAKTDHHYKRLEKKLRRLEIGFVASTCFVAVLIAALVMDRVRVPANISARGFSVVDEAGNELAGLARTPAGGVLVLESRSGSEKVFLGILENEAGLGLIARDRLRASMLMGKDGSSPALTLRDTEGRGRIMSGLDGEDLPSILIWNGEARVDFLVRPGHAPILEVFDEDGSSLLSVNPKSARGPDQWNLTKSGAEARQ